MIIGCDFDDVLFQAYLTLTAFHNKQFGTAIDHRAIRTWHLEPVWNCSTQEALARVAQWYDSEEHRFTLPVHGSFEAMTRLAPNHELVIVTARPPEVREQTLAWIQRHFPNVFTDIFFTNHEPKGSFCRRAGVSLFIEDALHHAKDVAQSGIPVLLFDAPWNQEPLEPKITRVFSWEEVLSVIDGENRTT